jgi:succinate dehydrogenase / fumarate reductase cytochrome b subunit
MTSVGKKIVSGVTGLASCGFIVAHLAGNLLLLVGADPFNEYTHFLSTLAHGFFLPVAEVGLVVLFLTHAAAGIRVALDKRGARPQKNVKVGNAGGPSQKTLASRTMVITGVVLFIFLLGHVYQFRLGPAQAEGYTTMLDGHEARDLYRLVIETFKDPVPVAVYSLVMLLLGFHLRHGFWSAFQSLGANNPKYMPWITTIGLVFAIVMAIGFLMIPIYIYAFIDPPGASSAAALMGGAP